MSAGGERPVPAARTGAAPAEGIASAPVATAAGGAARAWSVFTAVLTWAVFLQAVTAGRILSGDEWALDVHLAAAGLLVLVSLGGGLVALARLRHRAGGRRFAVALIAMSVGLLVQHGLGSAAADGEDTMWIHLPLGVALVGLMVKVGMLARRVGALT
jgi:hypothetical protein